MIDPVLLAHPLFQMNLVLWLTLPAPSDGPIRPVFYQHGFTLKYIEQKLAVPAAAREALARIGQSVQVGVRPDTLMEHQVTHTFLPVECKASSFGPSTDQAAQARGLLLLNGPALGNLLGKPPHEVWQAVTGYLSVAGQGVRLLATLDELIGQIRDVGHGPSVGASLEIEARDDGIYLSLVPGSSVPAGFELNPIPRVLHLAPGEDPRPLYLIPLMPDAPERQDAFARQVFDERLRVAGMRLFRYLDEHVHQYPFDDVMADTIQVWGFWGNEDDKRFVRGQARQFIQQIFKGVQNVTAEIGGVTCGFSRDGRTITIPAVTPLQAQVIRHYLQSRVVRRTPIQNEGVQGSLFD